MRLRGFAAMVLSISMLWAAPAYAEGEDAAAALRQARQKMSEMMDADAFYDLRIDMASPEESVAERMKMDLKVNQEKTTEVGPGVPPPLSFSIVNQVLLGDGKAADLTEENAYSNVTTSTYYVDGVYYMELMGVKMATRVSAMDGQEDAGIFSIDEPADFAGLLENLSMRTEGDSRIVTYDIEAEHLKKADDVTLGLGGFTTRVIGSFFNGEGSKKANVTLTINPEGYVTSAHLTMDTVLKVYGKDVSTQVVGDVTLKNPGQPAEILRPNPDEYLMVEE